MEVLQRNTGMPYSGLAVVLLKKGGYATSPINWTAVGKFGRKQGNSEK